MQSFKERLRELREERGLSMKELGAEIGVSDAAVCKWENGVAEPKLTYILRLAEYFDCSTDFLLCKTDDYALSKETYENFANTHDSFYEEIKKIERGEGKRASQSSTEPVPQTLKKKAK